MTAAKFTTVPLRCASCGEQTHKTLAAIVQNKGFLCQCGVHTSVDIEQFAEEIKKSEGVIKDFGRKLGSPR
jgi:DNA-directed RNA polymerase subunit N (RpoN/RPB10)